MKKTAVNFKQKKWHGIDLFCCEHCAFDVLNDRAAMAAHLFRAHGIVAEKKKERVIVPAVEKKDGE